MFVSLKTIKYDEIHISHKCKGAFRSWDLPKLCGENAIFAYSVVFDKDMYTEYENKKV